MKTIRRLEGLHSIRDFERVAKRRLPQPIFDLVAGGAEDEITLTTNETAFRSLVLRPRVLQDNPSRDLTTTVLGQNVSFPVILAPAGYQRMLDYRAELASARAAEQAKTIFVCNTISTYPLEEVAAATESPKWFQLYMPADLGKADDLISRVETAGYTTICLTVDTAIGGKRERDLRNRVSIPFELSARTIVQVLRRPWWALDFVRGGVGRKPALLPMSLDNAGRVVAATARPLTVSDLEWLRARWKGKLVVKGVLRGDDCERVLDQGADGVVVSNHGGRQLDTVTPSISALREIVHAAAGRGEVFVDGGIRRGTDIVKALALGARAVLIGRPYLYGLAVGGQAGVTRVLDILRGELDRAMGLLGCASIEDVGFDHVEMPPLPEM